jgi:hypothetical protein
VGVQRRQRPRARARLERPRHHGAVLGQGDEVGLVGVAAPVDPEVRGLDDDATLAREAAALVAAAGQLELPAFASQAQGDLEQEFDLGGGGGREAEGDELGAREVTGGHGREEADEHAAWVAAAGLGGDARDLAGAPDAALGDLEAVDLRAAREGQAEHRVLLAVARVVQGDAQAQVGPIAVGAVHDRLVAELLDDLEVALRVGLEIDLQGVGAGRAGQRGDAERGPQASHPAGEHGHLGTVAWFAPAGSRRGRRGERARGRAGAACQTSALVREIHCGAPGSPRPGGLACDLERHAR